MTEITSVWSADEYESCLTCGAMYELTADKDDGTYHAANGDEPHDCTYDTNMAHGYPGERHDGNADHDCNCLVCDS